MIPQHLRDVAGLLTSLRESMALRWSITAGDPEWLRTLDVAVKRLLELASDAGDEVVGGQGEERETAMVEGQPLWRDMSMSAEEAAAMQQELQEARASLARVTKENRILELAVPLEEDLSNNIDEMCKYLAMEQGFTLAGIARLLNECQRRMAADWNEIGRERLAAKQLREAKDAASARVQELEAWIDSLKDSAKVWVLMLRGDIAQPASLVDKRALTALVDSWRGPEADDARARGYIEASVQLQVCANELAAHLGGGIAPPDEPAATE